MALAGLEVTQCQTGLELAAAVLSPLLSSVSMCHHTWIEGGFLKKKRKSKHILSTPFPGAHHFNTGCHVTLKPNLVLFSVQLLKVALWF